MQAEHTAADNHEAVQAGYTAAGHRETVQAGYSAAGHRETIQSASTAPGTIICVTQRRLCRDFIYQLELIARAHPRQIILREKDMMPGDYEALLLQCRKICDRHEVPLFAHTFIDAARRSRVKKIHLPLPQLKALGHRPDGFEIVGTSIHAPEEALMAEALGADYVTAGHIFATDCKRGLPGRGLDFLRDVCGSTSLPVYAIGGITPQNMPEIMATGAVGGCMMSSLMTAEDPAEFLAELLPR